MTKFMAAAALPLLAGCEILTATLAMPVTPIGPKDALALVKNPSDPLMAPLFLDVRTRAEWENGHIEGSKLIPASELGERMKELESYRDRPIIVYGQGGKHSQIVASEMQSDGFTQVLHLEGGLFAWTQAGLPTVRETAAQPAP